MSDDRDDKEQPRPEVYRVPPRGPVRRDEGEEVSLVQLVNVLLRHRWKVLGLPALLVVVLVGMTLLEEPTYTSEASFMPQAGDGGGQISRLAGVASQFGVDVPSGQTGQSPQFYADLVTSRRLLRDAARASYTVSRSADTLRGSLVRLYGIRADPTPADAAGVEAPMPEEALAGAVGRLRRNLSVSADRETGVVQLAVTTPWPELSEQVAERLIEGVNQFNNQVRQSQASAQASFVGQRLEEARRDLRAAEDSLERFLERNVGWQQSPALRFEHDRLERRVTREQQVYTSLATRYEEARINEVRNTPVITSVDRPRRPVRPDSKGLVTKAALGLFLGGMLGVFWAFGAEFAARAREEADEDYREFVSLKEDAADDLKRVGRRVRRLLGSDSSEDGA